MIRQRKEHVEMVSVQCPIGLPWCMYWPWQLSYFGHSGLRGARFAELGITYCVCFKTLSNDTIRNNGSD